MGRKILSVPLLLLFSWMAAGSIGYPLAFLYSPGQAAPSEYVAGAGFWLAIIGLGVLALGGAIRLNERWPIAGVIGLIFGLGLVLEWRRGVPPHMAGILPGAILLLAGGMVLILLQKWSDKAGRTVLLGKDSIGRIWWIAGVLAVVTGISCRLGVEFVG